jgi:hypothetical protein
MDYVSTLDVDWERSGFKAKENSTPEQILEQKKQFLGEIYDNILENFGAFEDTMVGIGGTRSRVLHLNTFEAHEAYMKRYGNNLNVVESELKKSHAIARRNGLASVMGGDPLTYANILIDHLEKEIQAVEYAELTADTGVIKSGKTSTEIAAQKLQLLAIKNMRDNYFKMTGASAYTTSGFLKFVTAISSMFKSSVTINANMYSLLETPMIGILEKGYTFAADSIGKFGAAIAAIPVAFMPMESKRNLVKWGSAYGLNEALFPDLTRKPLGTEFSALSRGAVGAARGFENLVNAVKGNRFYETKNKSTSAHRWQLETGELISKNTAFNDLPPEFQETLNMWGVSSADWNMIIENRDLLLDMDYPFAGQGADAIGNLESPRFTAINNLRKTEVIRNKPLYNALSRLLFAENKFVEKSVKEVTTSMTAGILGGQINRPTLSNILKKEMFAFMGWMFRDTFDMIDGLDFRVRGGNPYERWANYNAQKIVSAFMMNRLRYWAQGQEPESIEQEVKDTISKSSILFFAPAFINEAIYGDGDNLDKFLNALEEASKSISRGQGGVSAGKLKQLWGDMQKLYELKYKKQDDILGQNQAKIAETMAKLTPLSGADALNYAINRWLVDKYIADVNPYAHLLFQKMITENLMHSDHIYMQGAEQGAFTDKAPFAGRPDKRDQILERRRQQEQLQEAMKVREQQKQEYSKQYEENRKNM